MFLPLATQTMKQRIKQFANISGILSVVFAIMFADTQLRQVFMYLYKGSPTIVDMFHDIVKCDISCMEWCVSFLDTSLALYGTTAILSMLTKPNFKFYATLVGLTRILRWACYLSTVIITDLFHEEELLGKLHIKSHDLIFSGHFNLCLCATLYWYYDHGYTVFPFTFTILYGVIMVVSKFHYTVDVIVAIFATLMTFKYMYHTKFYTQPEWGATRSMRKELKT